MLDMKVISRYDFLFLLVVCCCTG